MLKWFIAALIAAVGLINFAPLLGVMNVERLNALYGVDITSPDLALLMRHRAVLFGIVGGYILYSVAKPSHRPTAAFFGFISMISFMALHFVSDGTNSALERIFQIDAVAVALLALALMLDKKAGTAKLL